MKRFDSVQGRINLIFLTFALMVMVTVGATFWGIQIQRTDALVINLAGRQRMLTQKITWLVLAQPTNPELQASIQLFEQTLFTLRDGGTTQDVSATGSPASDKPEWSAMHLVTLPPAPDPELRAELDKVAQLWADFRHHLVPGDIQALEDASPALLSQLDLVVDQFEARAQAKLFRMRLILGIFFFVALVLLVWGYLLTRRRIFAPLVELGAVAQRMAGGQLSEPVPPMGTDELGELGKAFEVMRAEVASAQENLEGRVAQRTRELMAAFEVSQEIVAQLDLEHLLRSVTERIRSLMRAKAAALCLLDEDQSTLILAAGSPADEALLNIHQTLYRDPAHGVVCTGEPVVAQAECLQCAFLKAHAPGQSAVVPLHAAETTLGALCVVREPGQDFDADETRALTLLSNAAAIAIANARLVEAGRRQAEQAAVLSERERLASELHDNLAQTLSFLNLQVEQMKGMLDAGRVEKSIQALDRMRPAIRGAYEQVRTALVSLSEPPWGEDFDKKLDASLEELQRAYNLPITREAIDPSALKLPPLIQAQVIHVLREAVANAGKHAGAQHVWVGAECIDGGVRFTVEDDGCGFDPQTAVSGHHLGLRLMRARAERCGGTLMVESSQGCGTRVVAWFPV